MSAAREPEGLAFIKEIARFVCEEYGFTHEWSEEGDVFTVTVHTEPDRLRAVFDRNTLNDPHSDHYRAIADGFMTRLITQCRSARDARHRSSLQ
jgi:hypothetical protein